jgi:ribosome-binding protein aMBF1 (putative translation factor)
MTNRLTEVRRKRAMPQQALAARAAVSPSVINIVERWEYRPTERVREKIARALEYSL